MTVSTVIAYSIREAFLTLASLNEALFLDRFRSYVFRMNLKDPSRALC